MGGATYADEYEVDQRFTSIAELDGKLFAVVDETSEKAMGIGITGHGSGWDMYFGTYAEAYTSNACYYKIEPAQGEGVNDCYYLRTYKNDGTMYTAWDASKFGYFNSQTGTGGYFALGLNGQNGQDGKNHAVWEIEVSEGKFAIKNKATGKYLHADQTSNTYNDAFYFTFCTLKETEASIVARYKARYNEIKPLIEALDDDETIFEAGPTVDVSAADAALAAATTVAGVDAAIDKLYEAATSFVTSVTVKAGKYFDLSNIWIVNPTVRQNIDGWTLTNPTGYPTGWSSNGVTSNNETEFYQNQFDFYQALTLPKGTYEFGVTGFHRAGNHKTYFFAGEDKVLIPGVESSVVNSMSEAETYFNNGNGKVSLKFALEEESNTMNIGITNRDTETDKWTIFRDFTLHYYGSTVDYSVYKDRWTELVTEAGAAKTAHPNVTGKELADLDAAIADAPGASSKKADYIAKNGALEAAINTFTAAAQSYDTFAEHNTVANTLGVVLPSITSTTTAADLTASMSQIIVDEYNAAVSAYKSNFTSMLSDWTNAPGKNYKESWDGTTGDGSDEYYDEYNKADRAMTQTVTLPAGDYALIAKGRASGTARLTMTDGTNTITFPYKGSTGRGIATNGDATFDEGATYANSNNGHGWEYRVLTFTSDGSTPITLTFNWKTSSSQWAGLDDIVLLSKQGVTMSITAAKWATFVAPFDVTIPDGVTAYNVTGISGTTLVKEKVETTIPANKPVLLNSETVVDQTFYGKVVNGTPTNGILTGVYEDVKATVGTYVLQKHGDDVNFYIVASGEEPTVSANRAYLTAPATAKMLSFIDDDDVTIIEGIDAQNSEEYDAIYNAAGIQVKALQKGLNIVVKDGKSYKIYVK